MSGINSQMGVKVESVYGTGVVVDRFYEFTKAGPIKFKQQRIRGAGLRSTGWAEMSAQQRVAIQGASLSFEMEWKTKGMGWWLLHMLGATATAGPTDSAYTHTGTVGDLYGDFFTCQVNVPLHPAGTAQAFTLEGCKLASWELACDVDGMILFSGEIDAREVTTATGLATASYPSGMSPYAWVDVDFSIAAADHPIETWSLKCDNGLNLDRYFQQNSALKDEPTHQGRRRLTFECGGDFEALATILNRVRATADADAYEQLIVTADVTDAGQVIGAGTDPTTTITIPAVSFDDVDGIGKEGEGPGATAKLTGDVLWDGSNSLVTIAYVSDDATA